MEILGEGADKVVPLFISVDPDRDTPEVLAKYVQAFGSRMVGLTGTPEQVSAAAQAFRIFYSKVPQKGLPDGYLMGHSGFIYLMTPDGTYEASFSHERDTSETIAAAMVTICTKCIEHSPLLDPLPAPPPAPKSKQPITS